MLGGVASRFFSSFFARFAVPKTLSDCVLAWWGLFAFRFFGPEMPQSIVLVITLSPEKAESEQTTPFRLIKPLAVALLHYLQPSTKCAWPLNVTLQTERRDARPWVGRLED